MNARTNLFEFTCVGKSVNDIVSVIFHSVIFNRCFGKFEYHHDRSYSIGTLGFEEVYCDCIDFAYIRVASNELTKEINKEINTFVKELRTFGNIKTNHTNINRQSIHYLQQKHRYKDFALSAATGSISLKFLLKRKAKPFQTLMNLNDSLIWEVWTLKINCINDGFPESLFNKSTIEDQLSDKIFSIVALVNNFKAFSPPMPEEAELENIFDTSYSDVQPYNFNISYQIGKESKEKCAGGRLKKVLEKFSL